MPWQPFTPESGQRKALRDDSPDSLASLAGRTDHYRRRPSHLEEFVIQPSEKGMTSPSKQNKLEDKAEKAERRIKEKSSYKKLISNLQSTYQDLTQEQALRGILALRVENNGTLSGMTMLEITEGVIRFVRSNYDSRLEENSGSRNINSDDADGENSSLDDPDHSSERKLEIVESDTSNTAERRTDTEILRIPLVRQKKVPVPGPGASSTESEGDDSSDDSYSPDMEMSSQRKRSSPKKKDEDAQLKEKISPKQRTPRKKIEKVQLSVEDIEAEYPKMCRKRKFPSHFHEFSLPHPEPEDPDELSQDKQDAFHLYPRTKMSKKKRRETDDKENQDVGNKQTGDGDDGEDDINLAGLARDHGHCALCGLKFDQNSKKVEMTEKTRETGQTFADMLYGLFQDESLPPSLAEKGKSIELEEGFLCTLCVSYVDQMDVFQKKLSEIRSSILEVFMKKSKLEMARPSHEKSLPAEDKELPKVTKKRGRPPKVKNMESVDPPYKSENIELKESLESSKPGDRLDPGSEIIAHKLSVLSGIEIKRVNTKTGQETEAEIVAGDSQSAEKQKLKKKSPKKNIPLSETSDSSFAEACDTLEEELAPQTEDQSDLATPVRPNISSRGRASSRGRGQGRGRGRGRGTPISGRGTPLPVRPVPPPPPAKSKKSLFELSQERKRLSQGGGQPSVGGIQVSPAPSPPVSVSLPLPSPHTPEQLKQKRAYRKLVARIQGVHPELTSDEAIQGIIAVRDSHNGTLTGMSMQEIIARVRESLPDQSPPIGEEFEKMVFAPLNENAPAPVIEEAQLFEMKCQFCSRMFKSSSEVATKKVYEIHLHEHEVENRNVFDLERNTGEYDAEATDVELSRSEVTTPEVTKSSAEISSESQIVPSQPSTVGAADPVRSEISYCKICLKQFKNSKLYGIHQNTEHAAEKEFEKISNSS